MTDRSVIATPQRSDSTDRHAGLSVLALVLLFALLSACRTAADVAVERTTVLTWPAEAGGIAGQVIVTIRNEGGATVDADVFGRDTQTVAALVDGSGEILPDERTIQLDAVPQTLGPGEAGYLLASFTADAPDGTVAGAKVTVNASAVEARARPTFDELEFEELDGGLGLSGRLEWDGEGSAVARAVALDEEGIPIGFVATAEVRYSAGRVELCCFPPNVARDDIAGLEVFGILVRSDD